jgi:hypothetical protein
MRVDASRSEFHEAPSARNEFNRVELRRARYLLRRLRFLEAQIRESGGMQNDSGSGGAAFSEWEAEALEWVLTEIGFLREKESASL